MKSRYSHFTKKYISRIQFKVSSIYAVIFKIANNPLKKNIVSLTTYSQNWNTLNNEIVSNLLISQLTTNYSSKNFEDLFFWIKNVHILRVIRVVVEFGGVTKPEADTLTLFFDRAIITKSCSNYGTIGCFPWFLMIRTTSIISSKCSGNTE